MTTTLTQERGSPATTGSLAIEARGLVKAFGTTRALDGLDLSVPSGGVYAMLGPNSAGKTTAIRIFATLTRPDAGTARVLGYDVTADPHAVRSGICLAGQFATVDGGLTGTENLVLQARLRGFGRRAARDLAGELLETFGLTEVAGRAARTYSGGHRGRGQGDSPASPRGDRRQRFRARPAEPRRGVPGTDRGRAMTAAVAGTAAIAGRDRVPRPPMLRNSLTMGWRALLRTRHEPEQMADAIAIPVLFTVLFTYLFGGALSGSPREYLRFLLPGTLVMAVLLITVSSA